MRDDGQLKMLCACMLQQMDGPRAGMWKHQVNMLVTAEDPGRSHTVNPAIVACQVSVEGHTDVEMCMRVAVATAV